MKSIILKYSMFSVISIIVNFTAQEFTSLILKHISFWPIYLTIHAMVLSGTFFGLLTKYFLDKKYIFYHMTKNKTDDVKKFLLYTAMGLITTAIFWGFEFSFYYMYDYEYAKYIGGGIGLIIGYTSKYFLDKKYVFIN